MSCSEFADDISIDKTYGMTYDIFLDDMKIGTSLLEHADASMGCVNGQITFLEKKLDYEFFSEYCKNNNIKADEYPVEKLISTQTIPSLKVRNEKGTEIRGVGCYITGMDSDGYEINIIGIAYPFYEEEFPHHRKAMMINLVKQICRLSPCKISPRLTPQWSERLA